MIKLYYLRKYKTAAEVLGITPSQVKTIEEHALRCIRLAYSRSYRQGKKFDGETVLRHMKWIGMLNNIRNCTDEIVRNKLIYD